MTTLLINDLNDDLVNIFRELASKFGAKTQIITSQNLDPNLTETLPKNLSEALLAIPQLDGYDDEDIFASDNSPMRDIEWME